MRALPAALRHASSSLWRRLELAALIATIPAFYLALLSLQPLVARALYALACAASAAVVWTESHRSPPGHPDESRPAGHPLGLLLSAALALSALLPPGDALDLVGVRLVTAVLIVLRMGESTRPWFWRGSLPHLLTSALGVLGLCGLGFWWLEPQAHTFGGGLWLAFTTAATVGYGDIVPSTPAAKIFAVFVVLMGFAVLSLVTAAIAAMWVKSEERKIEHEMLRELHRELRTIRAELATLRAASVAPSRPLATVAAASAKSRRRTRGYSSRNPPL
jgi:voltage-gated potassium channel